MWGAFVWGVFLAVRGFSTWGGCPSSFVVNQAVGCVLFGLCRRDELVMGGSVKKGQHVGGVLPFIVGLWFGGGRGISFRNIVVITGFEVCICLRGITSVNGLFTNGRDVNPA